MRAAKAIIATVEAANPPLRLPLGNFAYDAMRAELDALRKEAEAVEAIARGAGLSQSPRSHSALASCSRAITSTASASLRTASISARKEAEAVEVIARGADFPKAE